MTTKGKIFTIRRSKWLRGEGGSNSSLLRERDGKMCCLGQVCKSLGLSDEEIREKRAPHLVRCRIPGIAWNWHATENARNMMATNDSRLMTDADREPLLRRLAKQSGFSLRFVD